MSTPKFQPGDKVRLVDPAAMPDFVTWLKMQQEIYRSFLGKDLTVREVRGIKNFLVYVDELENVGWFEKRFEFALQKSIDAAELLDLL